MIRTLLCAGLAAGFALPVHAQGTRLLRQPTVSAQHIAFAHAGDIWIVARAGGDALRLTSFPGVESHPAFSPDGKTLAFSGQYDGNTDVFTVPLDGGEPTRLTYHPGSERVLGWSPDGARVLFSSGRDSAPRGYGKPWSIAKEGGVPRKDFDLRIWNGNLSADGSRFAYQEVTPSDSEWRNYRGGQAHPIWVLDTADHSHVALPWEGEQQWDPVWLGDAVYFLSDRDLCMNIYRWDAGGTVTQLTHHKNFDAKQLDAGGGVLVYELGGYIQVFEPALGTTRRLTIHCKGDQPWARPHWEAVGDQVRAAALSPNGKRAVFEARGDIYTVPAADGSTRNLTRSSGAADREPSWSPDGKHVAWFSDASGEYRLMLSGQDGLDAPREIELPEPTFYYTPTWSPDSTRLAFTDEGLNIWVVELESGAATKVDTDQFAHPVRSVDPVWSPDSKWLAYAKRLDSQYHAVFLWSLESGAVTQITDGMADALSPAWDAGGDYLYFLASTNYALNTGWLDMTSYERPIRRTVYAAVLKKATPSPLAPKSDEEANGDADPITGEDLEDPYLDVKKWLVKAADKMENADESTDAEEEPDSSIDLDGLDRRFIALGMPAAHYARIVAGPEGMLFVAEVPDGAQAATLQLYELAENKHTTFLTGVNSFTVSSNGEKMLVGAGGGWRIVDTIVPPAAGAGALDLSGLTAKIDPRAEWRQMFRESWRLQRDYLYVPNVHGADWDAVYRMYEPWLAHVGHRSDLTYLLDILGGEVAVGHSFTFGGDNPDVARVQTGLLGADLSPENGRFRIARIYDGESWNPGLRAPLAGPGIDVSAGDYLLAVDGVELEADENPYAAFEGKAGRQTVITVNDRPSLDGARRVTVVPVASESQLRTHAWVEGNRHKVDELSGGRLAYVWLPDTGGGGYTNFNRYYFAQQDKPGAVIDERFNGGGSAADYMIDLMARDLVGYFNNPVGERKPFLSPQAGIFGPKVMIINESAGSGGDYLPYMFRHRGIGPLIGRRTWGGLVGIWDTPPLIDGGAITAPRGAFYDSEGNWAVENEGVAPDIEVEMTPKEVLAGGDPQLERAVAEALRLLEANPPKRMPEPAPPVRAVRPDR